MRWTRLLLTLLLPCIVAGPAIAESSVREVKLTLSPAPEPRPALKYSLLPSLVEQTPGDGMATYLSAGDSMDAASKDPDVNEKVEEWRETPADRMDWASVRAIVDRCSSQLAMFDAAARCRTAQWNLPFQTQGLYMELPRISFWRFGAKILAGRARLAVHEGRFDDALRSIQTNLAMARHTADGPTVIQGLIGNDIARLSLESIEEFVSKPGSPNLYWALSSLPEPCLIDPAKVLQGESYIVLGTWPELKDGMNAKLTAAQWDALLRKIVRILSSEGGLMMQVVPENYMLQVMRAYPKAKEYFRAQGLSAEQVEAMPVGKAILLYSLREFELLRDENFKWWNVPFWQAWPHMRKTDALLEQARREGRGAPLIMLVPSLWKARAQTVRLDKQIAALRAVEAIRVYAAAHGKLPTSLADIEEVPVPINPMTGQAFPYRLEGDSAVLEAPSPEGLPGGTFDQRYVLTIRK